MTFLILSRKKKITHTHTHREREGHNGTLWPIKFFVNISMWKKNYT